MNTFLKFSLVLLAVLLVVFGLHLGVLYLLDQPLLENKILAAYLMNYFLAIFIYLMLYLLKEKMTAHLGFLYMGGSFVKFILFFIFFYPAYKMDGTLSSLEFGAFFVPYVFSLIFETLGVINFLKK